MTKFDEEKKNLLLNLKQETLNQLLAIKNEDPEQFLHYTELCNKYIGSYNALNVHTGSLPEELSDELRAILIDIAAIREEISVLIPPLYEKLRNKSSTEKQINFAKHRYLKDHFPLPSVFMDKKK